MPDKPKIRKLSQAIIDQIAAGQVIQRPASVLKELVENSLDAGSTAIKVIVADGGKTLIQVIDNGCGMTPEDARASFQRHTTSKIASPKDLLKIGTYGFRGEAMGAIFSVAEAELITRPADATLGTRILVEESQIKGEEAVATPPGTQVTVRFLFRKVPGRRHFLKSHHVEMRHLIDGFQQAALSRPDVAFSLHQEDRELYQLPAASLSQRIKHLLGDRCQQLIPCVEASNNLQIKGYVGLPSKARKRRGGQFFFVNQRHVRSPYLHHAVQEAFHALLPPNTFPFYMLYITAPADAINVNVHPTKATVKFQEEGFLYTLMATAVRKALAKSHCMHTIQFDQTPTQAFLAFDVAAAPQEPETAPADEASPRELLSTAILREATPLLQGNSRPTKQIQLHKRYILSQVKSGLLVIDQCAAYECILYERYTEQIKQGKSSTQKLLFPYKIDCTPSDIALIQACKEDLYRLGFRFRISAKNTLHITGHPAHLQGQQVTDSLLTELLEQYKKDLTPSQLNSTYWIQALARRAGLSMRATPLTEKAMRDMVDQLFACKHPNRTPSGQPTWNIMSIAHFQQLLKK